MAHDTLYFAHPDNIHGSPLESELRTLLRAKWGSGTIIVEGGTVPNATTSFVALPFSDGMWDADSWDKANDFLDMNAGRFVWVIDPATRVIRFVPKMKNELRLSLDVSASRLVSPDGSYHQYE